MAPPRNSSAGISRTTRPRSITSTRSATSSTRSRFCSTISIDRPSLARNAASVAPISCTIEGWMPSLGSSSSSSQGPGTSARASARICCSPPESAPPRRSSRRASRGKASTTRCTACVSLSPLPARQARRRLSCALKPGRMPRPCGTYAMPMRLRKWAGVWVTSTPSSVMRPALGASSPISVFSSVVLPMPLWPTMPIASPSCTCNDTPCKTGTWP